MYTQNEKVDPINVAEEMKTSFLDYSMSVIISRALPDARDGLKPSQRRILYAMHELGLQPNRPHRKCAKIAGDTSGNYHPHGEQVIYPTLVHMAQDFSMRYPLVDGQGNFGSVDGDPPAAMRYTEARLTPLAVLLLADLDKDTVDFVPNYDESRTEPKIFPAGFPNLICNGSTGIAVGMATNIPPHNLSEIIDGLFAMIDDPDVTIKDLSKIIKGPDFPTGGLICGKGGIKDYFETGRGSIKMRGRLGVEEMKGGKQQIVISEIPFNVNKALLIEKIAGLVNDRALDGISDIRDESDKEGMRVVIELKRDAIPKVIINNLYKRTQLEDSFGVTLLALDRNRPRLMNIKEMLQCYIDHRHEVVVRRAKFELQKAEDRAHILEGFKIALDNLDDFVKIIRKAANRAEAKEKLMAKYKLSERQTDAILEMRLYQLTGLEREKIEEEYLAVIKRIEELRALLASEKKIFALIKDELTIVKEKHGDKRRSDIVAEEGEMSIEDLIAKEAAIITISHAGFIKRTAVSAYRSQRRGGKGVIGMEQREEDFVEQLFTASTHDELLFFTSNGRVYAEKVYEIPEAGRAAKGKGIANLLALKPDEKIAACLRIGEFKADQFVVFATRTGIIKKTNLGEFANTRKGGIVAINIEKGDTLLGVRLTNGKDEIVLVSRNGQSIRFHEDQMRDQGRATVGVWGMDLDKGDQLVAIEIVSPKATLLVAGESGVGKRTAFDEYRKQSRGGKGIITMKTTDKTGRVAGAITVTDTDQVMLITSDGQMIRTPVADIREAGRNTQGVRLVRLDGKDKLVALARVVSDEDEEKAETVETGKATEGKK